MFAAAPKLCKPQHQFCTLLHHMHTLVCLEVIQTTKDYMQQEACASCLSLIFLLSAFKPNLFI